MNRTSMLAGMFSTVLLVSPATSSALSFKQGIGASWSVTKVLIAGTMPSLVFEKMIEIVRNTKQIKSAPVAVKMGVIMLPAIVSGILSKAFLDVIKINNDLDYYNFDVDYYEKRNRQAYQDDEDFATFCIGFFSVLATAEKLAGEYNLRH